MENNNVSQLKTTLIEQPLIVIVRFHVHNSYNGDYERFKSEIDGSYANTNLYWSIAQNLKNIHGEAKVLDCIDRLVKYEQERLTV